MSEIVRLRKLDPSGGAEVARNFVYGLQKLRTKNSRIFYVIILTLSSKNELWKCTVFPEMELITIVLLLLVFITVTFSWYGIPNVLKKRLDYYQIKCNFNGNEAYGQNLTRNCGLSDFNQTRGKMIIWEHRPKSNWGALLYFISGKASGFTNAFRKSISSYQCKHFAPNVFLFYQNFEYMLHFFK